MRTATAFAMATSSERWFRSALFRLAMTGLSVVAVLLEVRTEEHHPGWIPFVLLSVPVIGTYLALMASRTSVVDVDVFDRDAIRKGAISSWARDPLTRLLVRHDLVSAHRMAPNISGVLEFLGAACLGGLLYWFTDPYMALLSLAGTIAYLVSINLGMYLDPSLYFPGTKDNCAFSILRACAGPVALLVACAVALPAFDDEHRLTALALCLALLGVGPRIHETDASFASATDLVLSARRDGRADINAAVHDHLMQPVGHLFRTLEQRPDLDREFFDDVRNLNGAIREVLALDREPEKGLDWPGVLLGRAEEIMGETGMRTELEVGPGSISDMDRRIARLVMDEFLTNAVKAGASEARGYVGLHDGQWTITVSDDGRPIDPETWLRPHGGLSRLLRMLKQHSGRLDIESPKTVTASWRATSQEQTR
ncbi:ATP-binding protein [Aeromicrobium flavum]